MSRIKLFEDFVSQNSSSDAKMNFYLEYYRNLTPQGFVVTLEGDSIVIRKQPSEGVVLSSKLFQ